MTAELLVLLAVLAAAPYIITGVVALLAFIGLAKRI